MTLERETDRAKRLVAIGEVARPHGVAGEVRIKLYNEASELLVRERSVVLKLANGQTRPTRTLRPRRAGNAIIAMLDGYPSRDAVEGLRSTQICVPRDELPEAEDGEYYAADLEGARVELATGEAVGTVLRVVSYPTCDALVVELTPPLAGGRVAGNIVEVPMLDTFVERVDASAPLVVVRSLEGLE